jgi:ATP-dependent DNA helicase RecG
MTKTELLEVIANGGNSAVEFRRDDRKPMDLAKELVAFANFDGGRVLMGVEDDGRISGLQHEPSDTEEWVMSVARDKVRPSLIPHFQVLRDVDAEWRRLLVNTEIMTETEETGDVTTTLAGVLLFARNPNRFLPQAGIHATAYPGTDTSYEAIESEDLRGPMVGLMAKTDGRPELVEPGLVEKALAFVRRNTTGPSEIHEETGQRIDRRDYPMEAVREAVVNALVHRDYLMGSTDIELVLYADRLEVISPGRLPNGITPDRMKTGTRSARNQLLKDFMSDYDYMEHRGLGVPRKIVKLMRERNDTEPDLEQRDDRFMVRLWKRQE